MLNVNKASLEDLINVFFVTNSDRVVQSIQNIAPSPDKLFIAKDDTTDAEKYLDFMYSKMELIPKKSSFVNERF